MSTKTAITSKIKVMNPSLRAVTDRFCERIGKVIEAGRSEISGNISIPSD
jgi:hypothetical protein